MQTVQYVPTLLLPSLNSEDYITIVNVTKDEATEFLTDFRTRVESKRRMKDNQNSTDDVLDTLDGSNLNLKALVADTSIEDLIKTLSRSEIRGARGRRAVFVDVENDILAVGTTVIYNQNWAMTGVLDPSIAGTVLSAVADAEADAA